MTLTNDDMMLQIEELFQQERKYNDGRYVLKETYDGDMAELKAEIKRLPVETAKQVASWRESQIRDAIKSALHEDFDVMWTAKRNEERKERRDDIKDVLLWTQRSAKFVVPMLQLVSIIITIYFALVH